MGSPITSKELTKRAKRFFILKDSFLAYFKSSEDETPVGVVPLEYFLLHTNDEKSKEKFINVEKYATGQLTLNTTGLATECKIVLELPEWMTFIGIAISLLPSLHLPIFVLLWIQIMSEI
jgi:hypothetical protein